MERVTISPSDPWQPRAARVWLRRNMSPITWTAIPAAIVRLLAAVTPVRAGRDPDDRCTAAILRASGRLANCVLQSDAGFVESDKVERYEKKVGRCEDSFARRHRRIIGRHGVANCPNDSANELGDIVLRSTALVSAATTSRGSTTW